MEDIDILEFMSTLPKQKESEFIREATRKLSKNYKIKR